MENYSPQEQSESVDKTPEQKFNEIKGIVLDYLKTGLNKTSALHKKLGDGAEAELEKLITMFEADVEIVDPNIDVSASNKIYDDKMIHIQFWDNDIFNKSENTSGDLGLYKKNKNILILPYDADEDTMIHEVYHILTNFSKSIKNTALINLDLEDILGPIFFEKESARFPSLEGESFDEKEKHLNIQIETLTKDYNALQIEINSLEEAINTLTSKKNRTLEEVKEIRGKQADKEKTRITILGKLALQKGYLEILQSLHSVISPDEIGARMFALRYALYKYCNIQFGAKIEQQDIEGLREQDIFRNDKTWDILDRWDGINEKLKDEGLLDLLNNKLASLEIDDKKKELSDLKQEVLG